MKNKRALGNYYEESVAEFLERSGYEIVERNFQDRRGEIDIIAREGRYLVFIEVKYRKDAKSGTPEEAVTPIKQERVRRAASHFLYMHRYSSYTPCRFDVVAVTGNEIHLIRDAF